MPAFQSTSIFRSNRGRQRFDAQLQFWTLLHELRKVPQRFRVTLRDIQIAHTTRGDFFIIQDVVNAVLIDPSCQSSPIEVPDMARDSAYGFFKDHLEINRSD